MQEKLNNLSKIALDVLKSSREKLIFICSDENAFCVNEINSLINHTNKNSCTVYAVFVSISSDDPDFFELEQEDFDKIKNSPGLFQKAYTQWLDGNFNGINKLFGRGAEGDATGDGAEGDATGDGAEGDATGDGAEGDATGDGAEGDATG
ncbi:hypothetical protein, partial [Nodularia spumigena]|uniref:hypothetical protein n=1 Tax=Nodularia spumigena TaxID=70799 RepID=UPI00232E7588